MLHVSPPQTHADELNGTENRGLFSALIDTIVHAVYMKANAALDWQVYVPLAGVDFLLFQTEAGSPRYALHYAVYHNLPKGSALKVFASGAAGQHPTVTLIWSPYEERN